MLSDDALKYHGYFKNCLCLKILKQSYFCFLWREYKFVNAFAVNLASLHKRVSYGRELSSLGHSCCKKTARAGPRLTTAKWNLIWTPLFHLQVLEKHNACLCIWILTPSTCLGFDFLTYSLAAFLLQCSVHCVVSHLLVSVSYLIPHVLGSQSAFHKDNIAELNRWGVNVLSVISICVDQWDRKRFFKRLKFSKDI